MAFSKETQPTTAFSKEALARGGVNISAQFGTAKFGQARFGQQGDFWLWTTGAKNPTTGFTSKEALP